MLAFLKNAAQQDIEVVVSTPVLAQVWRGPRSARVGLLLNNQVFVEPLTEQEAKVAGLLCAATRTSDVVDAGLVATALRFRLDIVTGDPSDIRGLVSAARQLGLGAVHRVVDLSKI